MDGTWKFLKQVPVVAESDPSFVLDCGLLVLEIFSNDCQSFFQDANELLSVEFTVPRCHRRRYHNGVCRLYGVH